jgi:hypothetical protein
MKYKITHAKHYFVLLISIFTLSSCSSDNNEDSKSTSLIGKWWNYKRVDAGKTNTSESCGQAFSCLTYEFGTNSCKVIENGEIINYMYKIDGDYIKFYDPNTEVLKHSRKFILTKDDLILYAYSSTMKDELHCKKI